VSWINSLLGILRKEFGEESFLVDEAAKALQENVNYSKGAIREALHQLAKKGFLI
jgi:DNA-binding FadR family transcriptional regulator